MTITTETELSGTYRALRKVIRPLRPLLAKPGKPLPAGSPRITNVPKSKNGYTFEERQESDVWLYQLTPAASVAADSAVKSTSTSTSKRHIYYFSGGAFQSLPTGAHWSTVASLARSLANDGYTVSLVSYPLAPNTRAIESLPILQKWLRGVMESAAAKDESILLMGDSAGGNIALSLTFWWAKESRSLSESNETTGGAAPASPSQRSVKGVLRDTVVISPVVDMHNSNPEMAKINKHDPILSIDYTGSVADQWSKGADKSDPLISPVYSSKEDFEQLRYLGVKIHGIVGTYDVLAPDALKFKDLCLEHGIEGDWLIWEGQMHCFPLASAYGIKEGKAALDWIARILKKEVTPMGKADGTLPSAVGA